MTKPTQLPDLDELFSGLQSISKSLEGCGRVDEHESPEAYGVILDAMNFVAKMTALRGVRDPEAKRRFQVSDDGRVITDMASSADVILRIDGDWDSDAARVEYANSVANRLNKPELPAFDHAEIPDGEVVNEPVEEGLNRTPFLLKTNDEFVAYCRKTYTPEALDHRGMVDLYALWAWQEQERRYAGLLTEMRGRKDAAYEERNRCVALIARMALALGHQVAVTKTAIEGWSEDWHGCVFIELPTGQVSWHFHDSQAHFFDGLPRSTVKWDGHTTEEKYARVMAAYQDTDTTTQPSTALDQTRAVLELMQRNREAQLAGLPAGTCPSCMGSGEIGGQFCGGTFETCSDCNGTGQAVNR